jgi:hypothetical protein
MKVKEPQPKPPLYPSPQTHPPKNLKNLKPNTLFLIYWYLPRKPNFRSHASPIRSRDSWVSGLRQTDAAPFFCCCRVAAFGSQDLSSRTSINGHWVSGSRVSGPRYSALRTWVSRPRHACNALRESRARARQKRDLRRVAALLDMSGIPFCRAGPSRPSVTDPSSVTDGQTDGQGTLYIQVGARDLRPLWSSSRTDISSIPLIGTDSS